MPAAFVTGGSGFLGWHAAKALAEAGIDVRAIVRGGAARATGLEDIPVEVFEGDLSESGIPEAALAGCSAVVHAAGLVKARTLAEYREVNVTGTERLLEAAQRSCPDALFLYVSSQAAAGPARGGRPVTEEDPARPVSWYGISKREGEEAVARGWAGPWVVLRPGVLYGPRDRGLLTYFQMARTGVLPVPAARSRVQIGSVEQTALAIARAARRTDLAGRTGFVCDPEPISLRELARLVADCSGRRVRLVDLPDSAVRLAGRLETVRETVTRRSRPFNADKAREVLAGDWLCDAAPMRRDLELPAPPPLEDGLRATWAWYRKEGWLAA
jgi:nucleoside-diphosphate-sugar epimerase